MIKYTYDDVKDLAREVTLCLHDKDENRWIKIVESIKEEFSDVKEMILEFLGPSLYAFTREHSKKIGLTDLIFKTPLKMMPLYVGSKHEWEVIVARWRLGLQK